VLTNVDHRSQKDQTREAEAHEREARDRVLLARMRQGDESALREVIKAYTPRLYSCIRDVVRDNSAAEDVLQIVFWKAWRHVDGFRGESSFSTWLYKIATNAAIDWWKHHRRTRSQPMTEIMELDVRDQRRGPADEVAGRDLEKHVHAAMLRLPEKFRVALQLREVEGRSYEEIATELGIAMGTVESRIFRARERLAKLLVEYGVRGGPEHGV
jgi:RNA polymerase sigma-70 factor (ECF subfamily)